MIIERTSAFGVNKEQKSLNNKTTFHSTEADISVDGHNYEDVELVISVGQITSAKAFHNDFTEEVEEAVSDWWFNENF